MTIKRDVDDLAAPAPVIKRLNGRKILMRKDGMGQSQPMAMFLSGLQQVLLGSDVALERHDDIFTYRIDCWIGHLSKQLLKVVVRKTGLIR